MRLFSVLLLTDVVLARRVPVLMYMCVCVCVLSPSHLELLTGETNFPGRPVRCACTKDNCFLCSYVSIIVISGSHKHV